MESSEQNNKHLIFAGIGLGLGLLLGAAGSYLLSSQSTETNESAPPRPSSKKSKKSKKKNFSFEYDEDDDFKMVLVVRADLKMGVGKIGSQCGHASVGAVTQMMQVNPEVVELWEDYCGAKKIVLKAVSLQVLMDKKNLADELGVPNYLVTDAGKTQIAPNSKTVLALGPAPEELIDKVTGDLKIYH